MEEKIGTRVNHNRTDEIIAAGADTVAVACPFCTIMLTDGVKDRNAEEKVQVLDVAELVAKSMKRKARSRARTRRRRADSAYGNPRLAGPLEPRVRLPNETSLWTTDTGGGCVLRVLPRGVGRARVARLWMLRNASAGDAPVDHGIDARRMDAAPGDTSSADGGLPCPQSPSLANVCPSSASSAYCSPTWDAIVSRPGPYATNGVATPALFVTGTGARRLLAFWRTTTMATKFGFFYYATSSGCAHRHRRRTGEQVQAAYAGLVAAIAPPCISLNSPPAGRRLVCPTDAGAA